MPLFYVFYNHISGVQGNAGQRPEPRKVTEILNHAFGYDPVFFSQTFS